jgi:hypothetical protein
MTDFLDEIERLMEKGLEVLTPFEISFLKARYDYLNDEEKIQLDKFLEYELGEDRGLKEKEEVDIDEIKLNNEINTVKDIAKKAVKSVVKKMKRGKKKKVKEVKNAI